MKPVAMVVGGLAVALTLTGCGAGQVSQMTTSGDSVDGMSGAAGDIALRNVHLRATQSTAFVEPGRQVDLVFTAVNDSPDVDDRLLSVTSDVGNVVLTGDTTVPASGLLDVGDPGSPAMALEAAQANPLVDATVSLTKPITNGLTYDFTFTFEKNGATTIPVPIAAPEASAPGGAGSGYGAAPGDEL